MFVQQSVSYFILYSCIIKKRQVKQNQIDIFIFIMSLFGRLFRVMTFGQSHASHVGCVVEGFPANFKVDLGFVQKQLDRRRPGQSTITTPRNQKDQVTCISGLQNGITLGSPLSFIVANENIKKGDYSQLKNIPRPGHADITYLRKYGVKAQSGGGRASARQTIGRVIAGSLAKQFLQTKGITFASYVKKISTFSIPQDLNNKLILQKISNDQIEAKSQIVKLKNGSFVKSDQNLQNNVQNVEEVFNLRCPHFESAVLMLQQINKAKKNKDSLGGVVQGCIYGLPLGLGQPCFDKLPALLANAMLSIPATKGFEYGSGFKAPQMKGSEHNDKFDSSLRLKTNNSGGTLGGISTGETFYYSVAFKPVSSIGFPQQTHDLNGKSITLQTKGRHDPCVLPRAPPIVDNMAAMVIMDLWLINNSQNYN